MRWSRGWFYGVGFTLAMTVLVALATLEIADHFALVMIASVVIGASFVRALFRDSRFFTVALANYLSVYACFFAFFTETNFAPLAPQLVWIGFVIPIATYLAGAIWRRAEIRTIVSARMVRDPRHVGRVFVWLIPVFAIGAFTFAVPALDLDAGVRNALFLGAMAVIGLIVLFVSRDVSAFLIDTGLMFEGFFETVARIALPAFAFFTFYSFLVIVFATLYRIIDRFSAAHHFVVNGVARDLSFTECLYFSLVTASTVGYGDIVPASPAIAFLVSLQIVSGVLLMLFGFYQIMTYARSGPDRD